MFRLKELYVFCLNISHLSLETTPIRIVLRMRPPNRDLVPHQFLHDKDPSILKGTRPKPVEHGSWYYLGMVETCPFF